MGDFEGSVRKEHISAEFDIFGPCSGNPGRNCLIRNRLLEYTITVTDGILQVQGFEGGGFVLVQRELDKFPLRLREQLAFGLEAFWA
jgi:hypothetical protein